MFTIKFYTDVENYYNCLEAPHYNVSRFKDGSNWVAEVTVYSDYLTSSGVSYRIADQMEVPHFKGAYVTNSKGKTIDHIRAMG